MLVHEQYRKCVSFVFVDVWDEDKSELARTPHASAFYVLVTRSGRPVPYAVTARHVVDAAARHEKMYLRVNRQAGGFDDIELGPEEWFRHRETDVAVSRLELDPKSVDLVFVPFEMLATDEYVSNMSIIEGDKVFFTGLFSQSPGLERSQPIVRFGNISLMRHEPLPLAIHPGSDQTTMVDAYLVEARSWGGHSGSPAFVYYADSDRQETIVARPTPAPKLLGLVHGHYEVKSDVKFRGDILGSGTVPVNAGMAAVIPSQHIIDLLMSEEVSKDAGD